MGVAISEDHLSLEQVAEGFSRTAQLLEQSRAILEGDTSAALALIPQFARLGWTSMHLDEASGGGGGSIADLAVVLDVMGRAAAPDTLLATCLASAVMASCPPSAPSRALTTALADGESIGGVALESDLQLGSDGRYDGKVDAVLGGAWASVIVVSTADDVIVLDAGDGGLQSVAADAFDPSSGMSALVLEGVLPTLVLPGAATTLTRLTMTMAAAVAAGGARATLDLAVDYAKIREQFGRTIGSFQAIKHHLADMLIDAERAAAAAWDAARAQAEGGPQAALAARVAAAVAAQASIRNAEMCVQVHGAIGFTWEHDAHLYLRKAHSLAAFVGATDQAPDEIFAITAAGTEREQRVELPAEAEKFREAARAFALAYRSKAAEDRQAFAAESGYLVPHWDAPWGRGAGPVEQLVLEEELAGLDMPHLGIGGWVLLTISQHATAEQCDRWIPPSLAGALQWCQLFSEPGAGSDAAGVRTRALRTDGGWVVTGQKTWTSGAQSSQRGLATVRTNTAVPKHQGITAMVIDLQAPGVSVRPVREMTGEKFFNEVFFDNVFVSDDDVVGAVDDGWSVARSTLANERISIGSDVPSRMTAMELAPALAASGDAARQRELGMLLADEQVLATMNLRQVEQAVAGSDGGAVGNLIKLAKAEHTQRVTELAMRAGGVGVVTGPGAATSWTYLMCRALTIAGGTSEISRNVIAERMLGLPREIINRT